MQVCISQSYFITPNCEFTSHKSEKKGQNCEFISRSFDFICQNCDFMSFFPHNFKFISHSTDFIAHKKKIIVR